MTPFDGNQKAKIVYTNFDCNTSLKPISINNTQSSFVNGSYTYTFTLNLPNVKTFTQILFPLAISSSNNLYLFNPVNSTNSTDKITTRSISSTQQIIKGIPTNVETKTIIAGPKQIKSFKTYTSNQYYCFIVIELSNSTALEGNRTLTVQLDSSSINNNYTLIVNSNNDIVFALYKDALWP